ncbi:hypothetical protein [Gelidibacter mesophilus]|uniref:hypothetical protein n=1 Tax=Gelidibacter mesophilus TaxID=169050 RepID=UPI0004263A25|nr:hypothetical protein [Gelidibacter mesophilus]
MIEVFKTNITDKTRAKSVRKEFLVRLPKSYINFDLEDCDRILRIENCTVHT